MSGHGRNKIILCICEVLTSNAKVKHNYNKHKNYLV